MSEEKIVQTDLDVKNLIEEARTKEDQVATHIVGADWADGLTGTSSVNPTEASSFVTGNNNAEEVSSDVTLAYGTELSGSISGTTDNSSDTVLGVEHASVSGGDIGLTEIATPRTITLGTDETGSATFDGGADISPKTINPVEKTYEKLSRDTVGKSTGVVLHDSEIREAAEQPAIGDLGGNVLKTVESYMTDMDAETASLKKYKEEIESALQSKGVNINDPYAVKEARKYLLKAGIDINDAVAIRNATAVDLSNLDTSHINDDNVEDMTVEDRYVKYNEAVVIIDKINMGQAIDFTAEERAKLRKASVIKLKEVEEVSLESIKIKRPKKDTPTKEILKRGRNPFSTNIVCIGSGYTATMRGGSSYEIIALLKEATNSKLDTQNKWQLIYDKIESMSCGKPADFTEWLKMTAAADYNIFIYGIMVATYPDDDSITFSCNHAECKKNKFEFEHKYTVRSLLRVERMSDIMQKRVQDTINHSGTVDDSKEFAESTAPLNISHRKKLPISEMLLDFQIQSAYDFINTSIEKLGNDDIDEKYAEMAVLSTCIPRVFVPDFEEGLDDTGNYSYFELTEPIDIVEALYSLQDKDLVIVNKLVDELQSDISFEFGMMNIECPKCHTITPYHAMEVENILFRKLQQAATLEVE